MLEKVAWALFIYEATHVFLDVDIIVISRLSFDSLLVFMPLDGQNKYAIYEAPEGHPSDGFTTKWPMDYLFLYALNTIKWKYILILLSHYNFQYALSSLIEAIRNGSREYHLSLSIASQEILSLAWFIW